jgi:hypothetical protein
MVKKPYTSDGQERLNAQPRAAPTLPGNYSSIGESARVGVLNDYGKMLNNQLTYWTSATAPCSVIDRSAAYSQNSVVHRINSIINTMAAACTEFSILGGAGQQMKPFTSLDYNAFTTVMAAIRAQLSAMQTAKP